MYDVRRAVRSWLCVVGVALVGCGAPGEGEEAVGVSEQRLAGDGAAGTLPAGLPARLGVGLFSDTGDTWMRDSGVEWDYRYRYFTKGWVDNWGWSAHDGSWGLQYMRECDQQGFVPVVQYYQMQDEPGGGEGQFYEKTRSATTMRSYFGDFEILMRRAKDFGKPVVILLEADGYALLQQQTGDDPDAYAAVAATGMPELQGLPDTAAGWGLAFLQIRKAVGATNAILGIHVSAWASGKDIAHFDVTAPLEPEVTKVHDYLAQLGLGDNVTGETYDLLVGDPLDRDADFYRLTQGQDRWWDPSDGASIQSKSFNRYAEWMRLWNQTARKRWILWQIPLGNSNHLNVANDGGARQGYEDNRPEYFFGEGTAHLEKFADAGAIALLFGAGAGGQSWYTNDYYTDGQLFMKSRAGAILNSGGVPIATGSGGGDGSGGSSGSGGQGSGGQGSGGSGGISGGGSSGGSGGGDSDCNAVEGTGTGLTGDYFSSMTLPAQGSAPALTRTDATVDFAWGNGAPAGSLPRDRFSVRWRGQVQPRFSGLYTFSTTSDDGVRLWVDGTRIIDDWTNHAPRESSGTIELVAGVQYDIVMEYYENTGGAVARLAWSSACEPEAVIARSQLYPAASAPADSAQYGFEAGTQGWSSSGGMITGLSSSAARAFAGARSLAVAVNGSGAQRVFVRQPTVAAGRTIAFRVYVPTGVNVASLQPYVLQGASGGWAWTGTWTAGSALQAGAWNTLTVTVPANAATPLYELGVELAVGSAANAVFHVDAVGW